MKEDIRDNRNQRIGEIDRQSNGRIAVFDKMGTRLGEIKPEGSKMVAFDKMGRRMANWDDKRDETVAPNGKKIGKGNLLVSLYFQ